MSKSLPLFLIKPKSMSEADIKRAERRCGIIIVECEDADAARFLEQPISAPLDEQARASLELMRVVMSHPENQQYGKSWLVNWFCKTLMNNKPAAPILPVKGKSK